ncbi:MAG TPA: hypothetical protein VEK07_01845 [Polyangiaceae bacterium]|nr:hypothetical protein [Polyangiaceae bacterium]
MKIRPRRSRIYPYLAHDLRQRLSQYCAAGGTTESAVVDAALRQYLDRTSDRTLLMRRLNRLDQAVRRGHGELGLLCEAFALFLKIWFAHTPAIAAEGRKAALTTSETRYRQFVEHLGARLTRGRRFVHDLPPECVGEGREPAPVSPAPHDTLPPAGDPA